MDISKLPAQGVYIWQKIQPIYIYSVKEAINHPSTHLHFSKQSINRINDRSAFLRTIQPSLECMKIMKPFYVIIEAQINYSSIYESSRIYVNFVLQVIKQKQVTKV